MLALIVLTPPFHVYDEPQHLGRAYQISTGSLLSTVQDGRSGFLLPTSFGTVYNAFIGTRAVTDRTVVPVTTRKLVETIEALRHPVPLDPDQVEFAELMGSSVYSPLPYVPDVAGILIVRAMGGGPLAMLYAARLCNAVVAIGLMMLALHTAPIGRRMMFVFGLLPSTLALFGSASPDASVISTSFLFVALALQARERDVWTPSAVATAAVVGVVFCSIKPVYAPLLVLALPFALVGRHPGNALRAHAIILATALGLSILWLLYTKPAIVPLPGRDPGRALADLFASPGTMARFIYYSLVSFGAEWFSGLIGILGFGTIHLPWLMYALPIAALLLALPDPAPWRPSWLECAWYLLIQLVCAFLICLLLYMFWAHYPSNKAYGVQGRYFLPLTPVLSAVLARLAPPRGGRAQSAVTILMSLEGLLTCVTIVMRFGVF